MKLKELLTGISVLECTADPELEIKEIFYDSRKVTPGSLFVAVSGFAARRQQVYSHGRGKGRGGGGHGEKTGGGYPLCSGGVRPAGAGAAGAQFLWPSRRSR